MFFTLGSRHEISAACMSKIMPILHRLCQHLLMLKIPLQHQTTSHYREEETINYPAGLDCLHDTLECWNIQTKYFWEYFSQLPQVSPSRVENGVILNNLSSHSLEPQPPHSTPPVTITRISRPELASIPLSLSISEKFSFSACFLYFSFKFPVIKEL